MLVQGGVPTGLLSPVLALFGCAEIAMAILVLATWRWRGMFVVQAVLMVAALVGVAIRSPAYLTHAFNPVTLNPAGCGAGKRPAGSLPIACRPARRCLRIDPRRHPKHEEMH